MLPRSCAIASSLVDRYPLDMARRRSLRNDLDDAIESFASAMVRMFGREAARALRGRSGRDALRVRVYFDATCLAANTNASRVVDAFPRAASETLPKQPAFVGTIGALSLLLDRAGPAAPRGSQPTRPALRCVS